MALRFSIVVAIVVHARSLLLLLLLFPGHHNCLVLPDAASVVLGTCNDGISLVVKGTRENLVFMAVECLQFISGVNAPHLARLVAARSNNLVALRVELNLTDLVLVTL